MLIIVVSYVIKIPFIFQRKSFIMWVFGFLGFLLKERTFYSIYPTVVNNITFYNVCVCAYVCVT
jgi:hypothetical protein